MSRFGLGLAWLGLIGLVLAGCGSDGGAGSATAATTSTSASARSGPASSGSSTATSTAGTRCLVRLHGKGGSGTDPVDEDGYVEISPTGNADGWGGRQWLYFPADRYAEARDVVTAAVDAAGCATLVVDGFSNGAAFAGELYCRGETFTGRLRGVVVDDPVPDHGSANCAPAAGVSVALYWTGGLDEQAKPGASCVPIDYTCDGGSMVGIDAYAAAMDAPIEASPNTSHEWYRGAPEIAAWLNGT